MSKKTNFESLLKKKILNSRQINSNYTSARDINDSGKNSLKSYTERYLSNDSVFFSRLDDYNGFFSTQQVESIDYEKFENHVFFDSAVDKVEFSFRRILNEFPYDGDSNKVDQYIKSLDGYTSYLLKNKIPKNIGYLKFDGTTFVKVIDRNGSLLGDFDKKSVKVGNLNPVDSNFSFDFWVYPLPFSEDSLDKKHVIAQKVYKDNGFVSGYVLYLDEYSSNENSCYINLEVAFDRSSISAKAKISTNKFQHVNFSVFNKVSGSKIKTKSINLYLDGLKRSLSISGKTGNPLKFVKELNQSYFYIGGSDDFISSDYVCFNGYIDEFRFFIKSNRTNKQISKEMFEGIFSRSSLYAYFKFNETSTEHSNNMIVLDSSGKKLHGVIRSISGQSLSSSDISILRQKVEGIDLPLKLEDTTLNPVLFSFESNSIKNTLKENATSYDLVNPNSFWKLLPKNLFVQNSDYDFVDEVFINRNDEVSNKKLGDVGNKNHALVKVLTIWARFFDQLKLYIDTFSSFISADYDEVGSNKKVEGMILPQVLKSMGIEFREILPLTLIEKLDNKNLKNEDVFSDISIRQIQNNLWKRFIINSQSYFSSKGTYRSLIEIFNNFGLRENDFIKFRENTGNNSFLINNQYYDKQKNKKFISFGNRSQLENILATTFDANGYPTNKNFLSSSDFSASNTELFTIDISNDFTFENYFYFNKKDFSILDNTQSLFRLDSKENVGGYFKPLINIISERRGFSDENHSIKAYVSLDGQTYEEIQISNSIKLFSGEIYYLCIRKKLDIKTNKHVISFDISSTRKNSNCLIEQSSFVMSQNFNTTARVNRIYFGNFDYSNKISTVDQLIYHTNLEGNITNIRGYSQSISDKILSKKRKDISFIGIEETSTIFEKLKINIDLSLTKSSTNLSKITSVINKDYYESVNNQNSEAIYFYMGSESVKEDTLIVKKILTLEQNEDINTPHSSNKIFINNVESEKIKSNLENESSSFFELDLNYLYSQDKRFYIDFSYINLLNNDISKILSVNDFFNNSIGNITSLYEDEYNDLESLRKIYFEKLSEEIDSTKFYQTYKYFDNILESLLRETVPSKLSFSGFNYVHTSHLLERNKYKSKLFNSIVPKGSENGNQFYETITRDFTESIEIIDTYSERRVIEWYQ